MRKAIITGSSDVGIAVVKFLVSNGYEVSIVVRSEEEVGLVRGVSAHPYVGDPADEDLMIKAGIDKAELLVMLYDDETNLRTAQIAKHHGVPLMIALMHDKERYFDAYMELNVTAISVADALLSKIVNYIRPSFKQLLFSDENIQAYYVIISSESPYIGRVVNDVANDCGVAIPLIIRDGEVLLTSDNLSIEVNDKLLIVGDKESVVICVERIH